jgi:hypothetical protein
MTLVPTVGEAELDVIRTAMVEQEGLIASVFRLLRNAPRSVALIVRCNLRLIDALSQ